MIRRPPRSPLFPYPTLFRSSPLPPYFGSRLIPSKPSSPHLRNTSRGKIPARSHSRAKGVSSRSTNERSEEHTSELQSRQYLVCRLLLEKKKKKTHHPT